MVWELKQIKNKNNIEEMLKQHLSIVSANDYYIPTSADVTATKFSEEVLSAMGSAVMSSVETFGTATETKGTSVFCMYLYNYSSTQQLKYFFFGCSYLSVVRKSKTVLLKKNIAKN
jgi:hypothetical protein